MVQTAATRHNVVVVVKPVNERPIMDIKRTVPSSVATSDEVLYLSASKSSRPIDPRRAALALDHHEFFLREALELGRGQRPDQRKQT